MGEKFKRAKGRPSKLTPEVQQKIVDAIRMGNYIETAAAYAGVSKVALYDWMKKGNQQQRGKYHDFLNAVEKALAEAEFRDVAIIGKAAAEHWQAAAWRLERKFPDRWGRRDRHEITGKDGGAIEIEVEWSGPKIDEEAAGDGESEG